jgi:hypothetical protein
VAQGKAIALSLKELKTSVILPKDTAPLIAAINGQRTLGQISQLAGLDQIRFGALWGKVERELIDWGLMLYSGLGHR